MFFIHALFLLSIFYQKTLNVDFLIHQLQKTYKWHEQIKNQKISLALKLILSLLEI